MKSVIGNKNTNESDGIIFGSFFCIKDHTWIEFFHQIYFITIAVLAAYSMGMSYLQEAIFKRIYHTWNVGRLYNVQPYVIALSIYPLQSR